MLWFEIYNYSIFYVEINNFVVSIFLVAFCAVKNIEDVNWWNAKIDNVNVMEKEPYEMLPRKFVPIFDYRVSVKHL